MSNPRLVIVSAFIFLCACSTETATGPILPSPPEAITASEMANRQIEIKWQARPASEKISSYDVYRDGLLIASTPGLSLVDSLATQSQMHEYSVASRADSIVSERSAGVSIFVRDAIPPRVILVTPAEGTVDVAPSVAVQVRFSESMDSTSFSASSVVVKDASSGAGYTGSLTYSKASRTLSWTPTPALPSQRRILVTVSSVKDTSGLSITQPVSFSFTIRETGAPTIVGFTPANGSTVPVGTFPTITFSKRMGNLAGLVWLNPAGSLYAQGGTQDTLTNTVTMTPTKRVQSNVPYTIRVNDQTTDRAGNPFEGTFTYTFMYGEWSLPEIASVYPAEGATGVELKPTLIVDLASPTQLYNDYEIRFNVRKTGASTTLGGIQVTPNSGTRITLIVPTLEPNTNYTAVFYHFFTDSKGVRRELEKVWSFTTGS